MLPHSIVDNIEALALKQNNVNIPPKNVHNLYLELIFPIRTRRINEERIIALFKGCPHIPVERNLPVKSNSILAKKLYPILYSYNDKAISNPNKKMTIFLKYFWRKHFIDKHNNVNPQHDSATKKMDFDAINVYNIIITK
jgi:hypothetical protein